MSRVACDGVNGDIDTDVKIHTQAGGRFEPLSRRFHDFYKSCFSKLLAFPVLDGDHLDVVLHRAVRRQPLAMTRQKNVCLLFYIIRLVSHQASKNRTRSIFKLSLRLGKLLDQFSSKIRHRKFCFLMKDIDRIETCGRGKSVKWHYS